VEPQRHRICDGERNRVAENSADWISAPAPPDKWKRRERDMSEANGSEKLKESNILSRRRRMLRGSSAFAVLVRAAPVALIALSFNGAAHAADVYNGATNGDWLAGAQWSTGVAPTTADDPTIVQSGSVLIGNGQNAQGGRLDVIGGASVGISAGGTLTTGFLSTIGLAPTSSIVGVPAGTTLTTNGAGSMTVNGAGATWNAGTPGVRVGNGGNGVLTISNGGALNMANGLLSVGLNANGDGTLNINNGSVTNAVGGVRLGYNGATGTMNITGGGKLTTSNLNKVGSDVDAASGTGGTGKVTISGDGSKWTITPGTPGAEGNLAIGLGKNANGTVTISDKGAIENAGEWAVGSTGGTGTLTVTGAGSSAINHKTFIVGTGAGSVGSVTIAAGATFENGTDMAVGFNGGATGSVTVTGTGSTMINHAALTLGHGTGSVGSLTVAAGATFTQLGENSEATRIGYDAGGGLGAGTGTLTVDGDGSAFISHNGAVAVGVGDQAVGTVNVSNKGLLDASGQQLIVASVAGGTGSLNITSGGQVLSAYTSIGDFGAGTAKIDGTGSNLTTDTLLVGTHSTANNSLTISGGGTAVVHGFTAIGFSGTGTMTVDGASSVLKTGALNVGSDADGIVAGHGTVNVTNGGSVVASNGISIGLDQTNAGVTSTGTLTVANNASIKASSIAVGSGIGGVGTLNIGTGTAAGIVDASVAMGGASSTINFNHNEAAYKFSNAINDAAAGAPAAGSVNFIGSGTTIFTEFNNYSSATNINSGELQIAEGASIANSVLTTVNSGARLSGGGTVGDVSVKSGGIIAPTGLNTLTVKNITFDSGSTFRVNVNPAGQNGSIAANTATINGGTVSILAGTGNYALGTTYTIIDTTNGVTGKFTDMVDVNFAFLQAGLDYADPNRVNLELTRNGTSFQSVAVTANQRATAGGLAGLPPDNSVVLAVVQQSAGGAQQAFDALSGEAHASAQGALINNSLAVGDMINNRLSQSFDNGASITTSNASVSSFAPEDSQASLNYAEGSKKIATKAPWPMARKAPIMVVPAVVYSAWAQGFGNWLTKGADGNAAELKSATGGVLSGIDATWMGMYRFGVAGGYSHSDINVGARASSLDVDSYYISAYGGVRQGGFGLQGGVAYGWNEISSTRTIAFPGFAQTALGSYNAGTAQVFGEANYRFMAGETAMQAFAGLNYINHHTDEFGETGGAAALLIRASDRDVAFSTIGMRAAAVLGQTNSVTFVGRGTLGWRHAYGDTDTAILASFVGGSPFDVTGTPITTDAVLGEAGLDMNISPSMTLGASWSGQFGEKANENRVNGKFVYRW
jgi:outer membrane autotransporter protein